MYDITQNFETVDSNGKTGASTTKIGTLAYEQTPTEVKHVTLGMADRLLSMQIRTQSVLSPAFRVVVTVTHDKVRYSKSGWYYGPTALTASAGAVSWSWDRWFAKISLMWPVRAGKSGATGAYKVKIHVRDLAGNENDFSHIYTIDHV